MIKRLLKLSIFISAAMLPIFITEKIILKDKKDGTLNSPLEKTERVIRLREHRPNTNRLIKPTNFIISQTDTLKEKGYRLTTDNDGFIVGKKNEKNPKISLLFLGGSTTESLYVEEKERFPNKVRLGLEKEFKDININSFNSGRAGNNSMHSLNIFLNKGLAINPTHAIILHNINDLIYLIRAESYWSKNEYSIKQSKQIVYIPKINFLKTKFKKTLPRIYTRLQIAKQKIVNNNKSIFNNDKKEKNIIKNLNYEILKDSFKKNITAFVTISKVYKIEPILMTQANRFTLNPDKLITEYSVPAINNELGISYSEFKNIYDAFNNIIREVGKEQNIMVIDLASEIPQTREYIYDSVHLNTKGSKLASKIITSNLINSLKIPFN